ncbi:hypothetical protein [Chondromyces crocatus]|uniref:Uncharacterized protein n=1 Tax=Chondromyces crocatus TaxID=52 RepID=A0A0K1EI23_CHOCO|nr:hypothetical protein [Chondromyces crocatus]AKT40510.1 uncharacterized protein CMC5_046650 [Chondromyces crocatus]
MIQAPETQLSVQVLRRNRLALVRSLGGLGLGPTFLLLGLGLQGESSFDGLLTLSGAALTIVSPSLALFVLLTNPHPVLVPATLRVSARGVVLDGRLALPRTRVRAGFLIPARQGVIVRIERRLGAALELLVADHEQGRDLLRALDLDSSQTTASFRLRSLGLGLRALRLGALAAFAVCAGALLGALTLDAPAALPFAIALLALVLLASVVILSVPARAMVGTDGVLVSWFWRERFIAHADLVRASVTYQRVPGVLLTLESGRTLLLPTRLGWNHEQVVRETRMLSERIEVGLSEARASGFTHDEERLARGKRPLPDWIRHLRALGAGADADHRTAPIAADRLWRLVEDTTTAPDIRVAAAVALSCSGGDARHRLRRVANATAAPHLHAAFSAVSEAETEAEAEADAALLKALSTLTPRLR